MMWDLSVGLVMISLIGFAAFNLWLRQQRRLMAHRERIAALEKGIDLPPHALDTRQNAWNVQRILLLAGPLLGGHWHRVVCGPEASHQ